MPTERRFDEVFRGAKYFRSGVSWRVSLFAAISAVMLSPARADVNPVATDSVVTYWQHVEPIVKARCRGCHTGEKPKGRLRLDDLESLLAGGKRGESVVAGKPEASLFYLVISGGKKPAMPPKKEEPLAATEIATIRSWILAGAHAGERVVEPEPYARQPQPPVYRRSAPITALLYGDPQPQRAPRLYVSGYREVLAFELASDAASPPRLLARFVGESERILSLSLSADGRYLAAAGGSPARFGEVQIWDTRSGGLRRFARIGSDTLFGVSFSPDASRVAVAGTDRAIHVVDLLSGHEAFSAELHSDWVFSLAYYGDGSRMISVGRDKTVKISESADGKFVRTLHTDGGPVTSLAVHSGRLLGVTGGEGALPIVFDLKELKEVRKIEKQPGAILATALSDDGKFCAVGGSGGEVRVYDVDSGSRRATVGDLGEWVYSLAFRPDGKELALAGYDGKVRLFDVEKGKGVHEFLPFPVGSKETLKRY